MAWLKYKNNGKQQEEIYTQWWNVDEPSATASTKQI